MIPDGYYEYQPLDEEFAEAGYEAYVVRILETAYENGRTALVLVAENGETIAKATVNLPGEPLNDGEVFIKTWGENEKMLDFLVKNRIVIDTGHDVQTGYVKARVCKLPK